MNKTKPRKKPSIKHFIVIAIAIWAAMVSASHGKAAGMTESECNFGAPFPPAKNHTLQCGYVEVPADHADPKSAPYKLHVALYKSTLTDKKADPIIVLNGGPGQRTASIAPAASYMVEALAPERDLVFFDQRGVGASQPSLDCPGFWDKAAELQSLSMTEQNQQMLNHLQQCFTDLEKAGVNLGTFNTLQSADDVALLIDALGTEKANLYGVSYGSRLAQEVMRRHPDKLRSVVLDAVVSTRANYLQNREGTVTQSLRTILQRCEADQACNTAYPDLSNRLEKLAERLDQEPLKIKVADLKTGQALEVPVNAATFGGTLTLMQYTTPLVLNIPAYIHATDKGELDVLTALVQYTQSMMGLSSVGMQFAFGCNEQIPFSKPEDLQVDLPIKAIQASFADVATTYAQACEGHQWNVIPASSLEPVQSDVPTLVLSGELDPVTPPTYAREVQAALKNSTLVTFPDGAHGTFDPTPGNCAGTLVEAFLNDPLAQVNPECAAVKHPFLIAPSK